MLNGSLSFIVDEVVCLRVAFCQARVDVLILQYVYLVLIGFDGGGGSDTCLRCV